MYKDHIYIQIVENILLLYRTWENFGWGKFWQINASKAFGGENFGKSASSQSKKSYT